MTNVASFSIFNDLSHKYRILKSLQVGRAINGNEIGPWNIEMELSEGYDANTTQVNIRFSGCLGVNVGDVFNSLAVEFKIIDIASHQIEGGRYRIVDNEGSKLEFICRSIEFS